MERELKIRECRAEDRGAVEALYPRAFPDEDLLPVVRDLLDDPGHTVALVAVIDGKVVGNIIFTRCGVDDCKADVALLAPLAVEPAQQGKGVGSALVRSGLQRLDEEGIGAVYVLGDPAYYGRLGFAPERSVKAPYELPEEWTDAWQSLRLGHATAPAEGRLVVPPPWRDAALWAP